MLSRSHSQGCVAQESGTKMPPLMKRVIFCGLYLGRVTGREMSSPTNPCKTSVPSHPQGDELEGVQE